MDCAAKAAVPADEVSGLAFLPKQVDSPLEVLRSTYPASRHPFNPEAFNPEALSRWFLECEHVLLLDGLSVALGRL